MKKFVWALLGLIIVWSSVWYLCLERHKILPDLTRSNPLKVVVEKVEPQSVTLTRSYIGHVEAIHAVSILPYITGFIEKVFISGGQEVSMGEILFVLKQEQYAAAVEAAKANVSQALADLEKAHLYLERIEKTDSEAISKTELDNARTTFLAAKANVANAKAGLQAAEINYDYTVIQSPIDGVVGNITATPGEYVSPNLSPLAYILQYNPIRVRFSMPEKDFLNLGADVSFFKSGELKLKLTDGVILTGKGSVLFADNKISSATSSIDLFADFENQSRQLLPGAYVTVLYEENIPDALVIDKSALNLHPEGDYVYLLKEGIIVRQPVQTGGSVGQMIVVESGLTSGDLVIKSPVSEAQVGQAAEIMEQSN